MNPIRSHDSPARIPEPYTFLCAVLRGDGPGFPARADDAFEQELISLALVHGVAAILFDKACSLGVLDSWPPESRQRFGAITRAQAVQELATKQELVSLLERFATAGIDALLIKGTPLAYTHYPAPYLRTRGDTDVLIPVSQRKLVHEVLLAAGYRTDKPHERKLASYQNMHIRDDPMGMRYSIDLHWRLSDLQPFSALLSFEELRGSSVSIPLLSPHARAPDPVHSLMIACMHRAKHVADPYFVDGVRYLEANRLIWLLDIHLLAENLPASQWRRLVDLSSTKLIRGVCLDSLQVTRACYATSIPDWVLDDLGAPGAAEPSAEYLRPGLPRRLLSDLRALRSWRQRLVLLREWAFPPSDHVLAKYGARSRWLLPFLHVRNLARGLRRIFGLRSN